MWPRSKVAVRLARRYGNALRRGKATAAVFSNATWCQRVVHSSGVDGEDTYSICAIDEARKAFVDTPRAKMQVRSDGVHVFDIGHPWGWVRYELR